MLSISASVWLPPVLVCFAASIHAAAVWRRLKGHTPVVAAGAAVAAGTMAAGQLASALAGTSQSQVPSGVRPVATSRTAVLVKILG
jgi:hypothetical protein